jgi:hypothetical protein
VNSKDVSVDSKAAGPVHNGLAAVEQTQNSPIFMFVFGAVLVLALVAVIRPQQGGGGGQAVYPTSGPLSYQYDVVDGLDETEGLNSYQDNGGADSKETLEADSTFS